MHDQGLLCTADGFLKVNLGNMVYILKFKLFGLDIWKDMYTFNFYFPTLLIVEKGMYMVLCDVDIYKLSFDVSLILNHTLDCLLFGYESRRINCGLVWWVVFLQTLVYLINFSLNVYLFPIVKTDCRVYYAYQYWLQLWLF